MVSAFQFWKKTKTIHLRFWNFGVGAAAAAASSLFGFALQFRHAFFIVVIIVFFGNLRYLVTVEGVILREVFLWYLWKTKGNLSSITITASLPRFKTCFVGANHGAHVGSSSNKDRGLAVVDAPRHQGALTCGCFVYDFQSYLQNWFQV